MDPLKGVVVDSKCDSEPTQSDIESMPWYAYLYFDLNMLPNNHIGNTSATKP